MENHKYSKAIGLSHISCETLLIHTIPKISEKGIPIVREKNQKTQTFQSWRFLIFFSWKRWISVVWEKYGKTQTFQIYGFLKYFGWNRKPYNSQNMGKENCHNTGKVWEKTDIRKLWFSQMFWVKQKSIQFPKYGKSEFT